MLLDCLLGRVGLSERLLRSVLFSLIQVWGQLLYFDWSFLKFVRLTTILVEADELRDLPLIFG